MFATCQVKMEQIILFMRNRELAFAFWQQVAQFCENFSWKPKPCFSLLRDAYNFNIDAYMYICNV